MNRFCRHHCIISQNLSLTFPPDTSIPIPSLPRAQMAELVDALRSGRSVLMDVEVRVLFWAPSNFQHLKTDLTL